MAGKGLEYRWRYINLRHGGQRVGRSMEVYTLLSSNYSFSVCLQPALCYCSPARADLYIFHPYSDADGSVRWWYCGSFQSSDPISDIPTILIEKHGLCLIVALVKFKFTIWCRPNELSLPPKALLHKWDAEQWISISDFTNKLNGCHKISIWLLNLSPAKAENR